MNNYLVWKFKNFKSIGNLSIITRLRIKNSRQEENKVFSSTQGFLGATALSRRSPLPEILIIDCELTRYLLFLSQLSFRNLLPNITIRIELANFAEKM